MKTSITETTTCFSLLWPMDDSHDRDFITIESQTFQDLELSQLISAISLVPQHQNEIEKIMKTLCADMNTINYRLDIIEDLMENPALISCIEKLLPVLSLFTHQQKPGKKDENTEIFELAGRLSELEGYIHCVQEFYNVFCHTKQNLHSRGLNALVKYIQDITEDELYKNLIDELPELLSNIRGIRSITIGVNLNKEMLPVEATLISINKKRYDGSSNLIKKIFQIKAQEYEGIAPLHTMPKKEFLFKDEYKVKRIYLNPGLYGYNMINPMLVPLFRDLSKIIKKVSKPVVKALKKYISINGSLFAGLGNEFAFYLGAIKMINKCKEAGLPMCRPELLPVNKRMCTIKNNYNINLALQFFSNSDIKNVKNAIVKNDVVMGPDGRIIILTGPNRGGKTTYTQGIGITQVLAQAGLYVPGTEAKISPVDGIFTHFPAEEKIDKGTGRLGDEARRLFSIFSYITGNSLLLLNESFVSTSAGESLYIARDIVRILRAIGVRVVYATHLHELGSAVDEINNSIEGTSKVISMVALVRHEKKDKTKTIIRTFKIKPGPPEGKSYALEIASKYGISFHQLQKTLTDRGIIKEGSE